jgi:hypothetical protein
LIVTIVSVCKRLVTRVKFQVTPGALVT